MGPGYRTHRGPAHPIARGRRPVETDEREPSVAVRREVHDQVEPSAGHRGERQHVGRGLLADVVHGAEPKVRPVGPVEPGRAHVEHLVEFSASISGAPAPHGVAASDAGTSRGRAGVGRRSPGRRPPPRGRSTGRRHTAYVVRPSSPARGRQRDLNVAASSVDSRSRTSVRVFGSCASACGRPPHPPAPAGPWPFRPAGPRGCGLGDHDVARPPLPRRRPRDRRSRRSRTNDRVGRAAPQRVMPSSSGRSSRACSTRHTSLGWSSRTAAALHGGRSAEDHRGCQTARRRVGPRSDASPGSSPHDQDPHQCLRRRVGHLAQPIDPPPLHTRPDHVAEQGSGARRWAHRPSRSWSSLSSRRASPCAGPGRSPGQSLLPSLLDSRSSARSTRGVHPHSVSRITRVRRSPVAASTHEVAALLELVQQVVHRLLGRVGACGQDTRPHPSGGGVLEHPQVRRKDVGVPGGGEPGHDLVTTSTVGRRSSAAARHSVDVLLPQA